MRQSVVTVTETQPGSPGARGHHTCKACPVCGTEECFVFQDLGMACDTAQAAQASMGARGAARGGSSPGRPARPGRPRTAP